MTQDLCRHKPLTFTGIPWYFIMLLTGCVTQTAYQPQARFDKSQYHDLQIEKCIDRSDYQGSHHLANEASDALVEKITGSGLFRVTPNADLLMTCDIDKFSEGNAFKRWLWPNWGVTRAEISVMIWKKADSSVLATFKSQTEVGSGGLYTIGAGHYVIGVALNDIVKQLRAWVENRDVEK